MELARKNTTRVFLSAGEASGDLHGAHLVQAIRARDPAVRITCLGGPRLRQAGAEVLVDNRQLSVVGLFEVVRHAKLIYHAYQKIKQHLIASRPQVVVLIDFPDFNFLLARIARQVGSRVFYYISPQIWAWRKGRIRQIKLLVDEMAVILPFEANFYASCGMRVSYVGHPLLDVIDSLPTNDRDGQRYRPEDGKFLLGLLPGSRPGEVRQLLPLLLDAAEMIRRQFASVTFIIPVAVSLDFKLVEIEAAKRDLPLQVVSGDTYAVLRACDLIITASGTVTLEAAILATPMIIIYQVSNFTYYAGRHLIRVKHVGLPNLIAGRCIAPELLQQDANAPAIAAQSVAFLNHPERLRQQRDELAGVRGRLGKPGVAQRVADLVLAQCAASTGGS